MLRSASAAETDWIWAIDD